ncbi:MAG: helix-turn-helix transcriptional regulator [Proteobacteria bacterium]|nr:helix-turn-helix transcriptional regulator [Pseudomonadota bacterium]
MTGRSSKPIIHDMSERRMILDWMDEILAAKGWKPKNWADAAGVDATTITRFRKHKHASLPSGKTLFKLAKAAGDDLPGKRRYAKNGQRTESNNTAGHIDNTADLPEVTSVISSRHVEVMRLDVRLGLGGGGGGEEDFIGDPELMPISLIEGVLRGHSTDFLLYEVECTSMSPDLLSGDRVLIDRRKTNPSQPGIFALFDGFGLVAKLVERVPRSDPPQFRIISRDPDLTPHEATLDEIRIIGRVVWYARRL